MHSWSLVQIWRAPKTRACYVIVNVCKQLAEGALTAAFDVMIKVSKFWEFNENGHSNPAIA